MPRDKIGGGVLSNKQPSDFEPLAHEQKISQWYQQMNAESKQQPSSKLDANILNVAKKVAQKSLKNNALQNTHGTNTAAEGVGSDATKHALIPSEKKNKPRSKWYRHLSLAASVAILGVLFFSQYDFFVSPEVALRQPVTLPTPAEIQELSEAPSSQKTTDKEVAATDTASKARLLYESVQERKRASSEELPLKQSPVKLPTTSVAQLNKPDIKEKMVDNARLAENSAQTQPMSLYEMSKWAEVLRLEMAIGQLTDTLEVKPQEKVTKMQRTLFEHLTVYQSAHPEYQIEEKFLRVLTLSQVNQLKSVSVDNELDNTSELKN